MTYITIITRRCLHCGKEGQLVVNDEQWVRYKEGALIQEAFPDMDKAVREQLMTGIHLDCWNIIFSEEE